MDEIAASGELFDSGRKLSTLSEKLSTRSLTLPYSEFTPKISSNANDVSFIAHPTGETLSDLALPFTTGELSGYVSNRITGLAQLSCKWITQAAKMFWQATVGIISQHTIEQLRTETLQRYHSWWSHSKILSFAKSFLSYLTKTKLDTRYLAFEVFLAMPKRVRVRKAVTSRIITVADIRNVLSRIKRAEQDSKISKQRSLQCTAFIVFGAHTGQRTMATMSRLKVGQFRAVLQTEKPALLVNAEQDKIRMQHYVPLHPEAIRAIELLLGGRSDDESMFAYDSVLTWIKREKIPLSRIATHLTLGDLRKFAEQCGDVIQWEQSNRAHILTHGVSGVSWSHYQNPLPENVYDIYMEYWENVDITV